jgi:hypothetical protein
MYWRCAPYLYSLARSCWGPFEFLKVQRQKPSRIAASNRRSGIREHRSGFRSGVLIPRRRITPGVCVKHEYVGAAGRKGLYVGNGHLPFGAGEGFLNGRDVVVVQECHQVMLDGPAGVATAPAADFVFSQAGIFFANGMCFSK